MMIDDHLTLFFFFILKYDNFLNMLFYQYCVSYYNQ